MVNLAGFQTALQSANITGDWSNNPANSVGVDWVLSFPNKYAYLDLIPAAHASGGADSGQEWCLLHQTRTGYGLDVGIPDGIWTGVVYDPGTGDVDGLFGIADLCLNDNGLRSMTKRRQRPPRTSPSRRAAARRSTSAAR